MIARIAHVLLVFSLAAFAGPPLTTIQDVLYRADGSRFSGLLLISWSSFEASDTTNITTHSLTVRVNNGSLKVQLVPTTNSTPLTYYSVKYNSDGRVQFEETWAVGASAQPLRVRDVRVPAATQIGNETAATVQLSDVVGLASELSARPVKAATYSAGKVVFANPQGALESVSGNDADCVHVDGSTGPCGGAGGNSFVDGETPAGIVDGTNAAFTVAVLPSPASSLAVYRNGLLMKAGFDYSLSGRDLTFLPGAIPQAGDTLLAAYRIAGSSGTAYAGPQVLCSGVGAVTNAATDTSIATCTIPSGLLNAGDRLEIRFALEHGGTAGGFHFAVKWGSGPLVQRDASAADVFVSGRGDAAVLAGSAQLSGQSWGNVLPLLSSVATAESGTDGVTIEFLGRVGAAGADTLSLKNFTVIRFP